MMDEPASFLSVHWKWLTLLISTAFGIGVVRAKIAMKSELYNKDGSQIYVPKSEFDKIAERVNEMNYTLGQIDQFMKERIK